MADSDGGGAAGERGPGGGGCSAVDSASVVRDLLRSRIEESNRLQSQLNDAVGRLAELSLAVEEKEFELKTLRLSLDAEQKRSGMYEEELRKMQQLYQHMLTAAAAHRPLEPLSGTVGLAAAEPAADEKARALTGGSADEAAAEGSPLATPDTSASSAAVQAALEHAPEEDDGPDEAEGEAGPDDEGRDKKARSSTAAAKVNGFYSGWMYKLKLGKRFKQTWKRRYFTLTNTHLHYYVSPSDPKAKGSMAIICLTVSARVDKEVNPGDKEFCFTVVEDLSWLDSQNDQRRNYLFATDNEDERKEWISLLKAAKSNAHKTAAEARA